MPRIRALRRPAEGYTATAEAPLRHDYPELSRFLTYDPSGIAGRKSWRPALAAVDECRRPHCVGAESAGDPVQGRFSLPPGGAVLAERELSRGGGGPHESSRPDPHPPEPGLPAPARRRVQPAG